MVSEGWEEETPSPSRRQRAPPALPFALTAEPLIPTRFTLAVAVPSGHVRPYAHAGEQPDGEEVIEHQPESLRGRCADDRGVSRWVYPDRLSGAWDVLRKPSK